MPLYHVHVRRTEDLTFEIDAQNEDGARERYLRDGDEIASHLDTQPEVLYIEEIKP